MALTLAETSRMATVQMFHFYIAMDAATFHLFA